MTAGAPIGERLEKNVLTFSSRDLEEAIIRLLQTEPYYGYMLMAVTYLETKRIPTAGMNAKGQMLFNPSFMAEGSVTDRVGTIKHELMHLLYRHPVEGALYSNKLRWNIACDVCINQMIPEIPKTGPRAGLFPETWTNPDGSPNPLPQDLTAEEYYDLLPKEEGTIRAMAVAALGKAGSGMGPPEHFWELPPEVAERAAEILGHALDRYAARTRGKLPRGLQEALDGLRSLHQVDWKATLRRLAKSFLRGEWRFRWKRPDRRLGQVPARQRERKLRIGIAIDTSGSTMGVRGIFAGELDTIKKETGFPMVVCECDAAVGRTYEVPAGKKWDPPKHMTGGGGTAFQPAIDWFEEHNRKHPNERVAVLIYLTDGWGESPQKPPSFPVIWVETTDTKAAPYGHHIRIRPEEAGKKERRI